MSVFRDPSTVFSWHRGDVNPVVAAKEIVFKADRAGTEAKILMRVDNTVFEFTALSEVTRFQDTPIPNLLYGGDRMASGVWEVVAGATLGGNTATLATAGDEIKRPYPGWVQRDHPAFLGGVNYVSRIAIKNASSGTQDGDVEVYFEDPAATTEWIVMTIPKALILDRWRHFALEFVPGSDATGTVEYRVRYKTGGSLGISLGQAHVCQSKKVWTFDVSQREAFEGWTPSTVVPPPNAVGFKRELGFLITETV